MAPFLKPTVKSGLSPEEIIGDHLLFDFVNHFRKTYQCRSLEGFAKAVAGFSPAMRESISQTYTQLHKHGWYPRGLDELDNIKWSYRSSIGVQEEPDEPVNFTRVPVENLKAFFVDLQNRTTSPVQNLSHEDFYSPEDIGKMRAGGYQ